MKISIEKNQDKNRENTPFIAYIDTSDITIHASSVFAVPVVTVFEGQQKRLGVDMCGFGVTAVTLEELTAKIEQLLNKLINIARFPKHVFVAQRAQKVYPVYTIGNEVMVTTPGGPIFQHVELAKVREYLSDYLNESGILGENGLSDKLHVRGVNMTTLGLRRPVFYLKKRVVGETDFWAPVFENGAGNAIYTYAANARRDVPLQGGQEVLMMREIVAQVLLTDGRLSNLLDVRPDRLRPHYWERLKKTLTPEGTIEKNGGEIELYRSGNIWIGAEKRPEEERYGLYLGLSKEGLIGRLTQDFIRRGLPTA